jgi:hypothetical protein
MPQEFRYPLTRICLRNGRLTLPLKMLDVFPSEGNVTAFDSRRGGEGETFELTVEGPRRITGLERFFADNDLEVNDALLIRPLEDGRYALTAAPRPRKPDYGRRDVVQSLVDDIVAASTPLTVGEIRGVYPDLPADFDLERVLSNDGRLHRVEGRWRPIAFEPPPPPPPVVQEVAPAADERAVAVTVDAGTPQANATQAASSGPPLPPPASVATPSESEAAPSEPVSASPTEVRSAPSDGAADPFIDPQRDPVAEVAGSVEEDRAVAAPAEPVVGSSEPEVEPEAPPARAERSTGARERRRVTVTPYPRGVMFPSEVGLNSESEPGDLTLVQRTREALREFGYRVDSLPHGQLLAHAELGRYQYRVLIHVLPDRERLDWAALMAKRREVAAKYLSVFGDVRDLQRLFAPADMARATLWSWDGLARVRDLSRTVLISPIDLEQHFERDGMFEGGLVRFERTVEERIRERGAFSSVLTRLAALRAPAIFVLDDLTGDVDLTRDQLLRVVERLTEAPFHLVIRVGNGEFCLRNRVGDALLNVSEYALSLRDRLPVRTRDRVIAVAEPGSIEPIVDESALGLSEDVGTDLT